MRGDAYHAGPVMLSDVYTSAVGSAKDGVAASQRALYDAYNSLNSSKLSINGGVLRDSIRAIYDGIDASKADNNVTTRQWPTMSSINDKNDRILTRQEALIDPNGDISAYWYLRNYNTSGNMVAQKGIKMILNKSGGFSYAIDNPVEFLDALGIRYGTKTVTGLKTTNWALSQHIYTNSGQAYYSAVTITYGKTYTNAPTVLVSPLDPGLGVYGAEVESRSTSSFAALIYGPSNSITAYSIFWMAIGT